jgi:hypothetical protein
MIDAIRLTLAWGLVWVLGAAIVAGLWSNGTLRRGGAGAWVIGYGYFVGAFVLTLWMRVISFAGLQFSIATIAIPLLVAAVVLGWKWKRRKDRASRIADRGPSVEGPASTPDDASRVRLHRFFLYAIVAWLACRFIVLLLDVVWTPLYPWDAWIQWATKARVWYSLGHIVPFGRSDAWFAANGAIWFDASPNYPATIPLWQVWSSVALGRFDDALMNVPWWLAGVALAIAVYGVLRVTGASALVSSIAAWLVSSLPLANVHVALAGYADLPMAAYFALAALAMWRWSQQRSLGNAALALLLALACTTVKIPGIVWALTLVPGVVVAMLPERGPRIALIGLGVVLLLLAVLAQTNPTILGYRLHLDFAPAWRALVGSFFVFGNWHLLWYALIVIVIVGWRELRSPDLITLSVTTGAGMLFLFIVFCFTNAREWVTDQTTINRALLHMAPLALVFGVLVARAWFARVQAQAPSMGAAPATP